MPTEKPTSPESPVAAAVAEIAGELGTVVKEQVDAGRGGTYQAFTIDKIYEAVRPMLAARGVAVFPRPPHVEYTEHVTSSGGIQTTARYNGSWMLVHAASGDEVLIGFEASARDNGDKAPIQAGQQAFKYAIVQMLQLGAGDPEAERPPEEAFDPKVAAKAEAEKRKQLENAARVHLFAYMAGDKITVAQQAKEAEAAWPLVLEASGVKEIATEADRDAIIAAADKMYGEKDDEAGKQETMKEDK